MVDEMGGHVIIPESWESVLAKNARLFFVDGHKTYSKLVTDGLLSLQVPNVSPLCYDVIAVCGYPPTFFFGEILRGARGHALTVLRNFAELADDEIPPLEDPVPEGLLETKRCFLDAAKIVFPHFNEMDTRCAEKKLRQLRLCFIGESLNKSGQARPVFSSWMIDPDHEERYLRALKSAVPKPQAYAFFKWLNQNMICRIIPPSLWDYWGISSTRIIDFAIFDHHVLVTYYPNERFMLYVRPISDQWRLLSCNKFLGALSTAVIDYYWTPEEFMRIVYQGPTSTNEKLCKEIKRLMAYVDKEQTVQTTYGELKENVCRQILGVLGTVTEREAKDLMKKPPFNRPRKLSLIKDYAVNQKEVLKELTELVKPHK